MSQSRQLAAIMFTDIVGYTALMGRDEQKAFELLYKNRAIQKPVIEEYHGRWIKELGDGVMASFNSVSDAATAAIKIQEVCNTANEFKLRIGIHLGDVVFENDDVFGDGVNIASRIQAIAPIGGIWVSELVHLNLVNKNEINTEYVKTIEFKNVKEPIKIYEIKLKSSNNPGSQTSPISMFRRREQAYWRKSAMISLGIFIILVAVYLMIKGILKTENNINESFDSVKDKSIAVLPFVDMSAGKDQEYFSDGLSEELLNLLAKIPELKVIGRTSSFSFKGKNEDLRSIAQKLGVAHILEGSVRKDGNKIRITTQLIKATDGSHLWSESYDRDLEGILKLQDEIANAVVKQLKLKLLITTVKVVSPTTNTEVYNLILQGNYFFDKRDKENTAMALEFYLQALALDSLDARALAKVSYVYAWSAWQNYMDQKEGYQKAEEAALKAISLDPNLTDGHIALGLKKAKSFDWGGAKAAFEKVLLSEPANAEALHHLSGVYGTEGNFRKAIELESKALTLDPLKTIFYSSHAAAYTYANRFEEANTAYKKALEINPQFARAHMYLGRNLLLQGKPELALQEMQKENGEVFKQFGLALAYYALNNKNRAHELLNDFITTYQQQWPYLVAELYAFRGEKDKAIEWLQKAYERNDSWLTWIKGDPLLKNVWRQPGYINILKKLNLPTD